MFSVLVLIIYDIFLVYFTFLVFAKDKKYSDVFYFILQERIP